MAANLSRGLIYAFAAALIFLIANAVFSLIQADTLMKNNARVLQTQDYVNSVEETLSVLKDAETGQRGYLITGDPRFLEPYANSMARIGGLLERLEVTTTDAHQLKLLKDLRTAIGVRDRTLLDNITTKNREGLDALVRSGKLLVGKQQMDEVRRLVAEIHGAEERMLEERTQASQRSGRNTIITFLAANSLAIVLLGFTYYLTRKTLIEKAKGEEALRAAHDELEIRVHKRTEELAEINIELERSNRELQDFAFVASHDLQEPLRKIQAFGDRLRTVQGDKFDERGRDYLDRMSNAAERMHRLINDLLTFSRVTTKAQPFRLTELGEIVKDVVGDLETTIEQSGGTLDIGELPAIEADPTQMRQLFQNLIANALKFRRQGVNPSVVISSELVQHEVANGGRPGKRTFVEISVTDNGIGFDEKYLGRIFTPFQRLHGRNEYAGTGIGLAVCRKIAERHKGTLTARSEVNVGSTFTISLPIEQEKEN